MIEIEKKTITLNGNDIEYALKGSKSPTLILINGAGGAIEGWFRIWGELGGDNVLFAYNRPGIGKSSKPKEPQTGRVMANDLKELLLKLKIEPPYIVLGHSLGGFIAHIFAATFPDDVKGIIFLESSTIKDVLSNSKEKNVVGLNKSSEIEHILTTVDQINTLDKFPDIPVIVIAGSKPAFGWFIPKSIKEARFNNQKELLNLSRKGRLIIASKSGHFPQLTEPKLVIKEINNLINEISYESN